MGSTPSTNTPAFPSVLGGVLGGVLAGPAGLISDIGRAVRGLAGRRPPGGKSCKDFASQAEAQAYFEARGGNARNNVDNLDHNHNGIACEVYPYDRTGAAVPPWLRAGVRRLVVPGAFAAVGWAAGRQHRAG